MQNLESPFGKVLILFVRNRHCGGLIRGLENLGKLSKGKFQRPRSGKGFKLVCAKFLSVGAELRFAEPRCSLKKVLIVAVRSCGCGVMIRGLQNLDAPLKRF